MVGFSMGDWEKACEGMGNPYATALVLLGMGFPTGRRLQTGSPWSHQAEPCQG